MYDTTRAASTSGDALREAYVIWGMPRDIVRKVLTSTGAGTNGAYDTLTDGMEVPEGLIGGFGWTASTQGSPASGSYHLDVVIEGDVPNPLTWMQGWLAPQGMVLVAHGGIDFRVIWDPQKTLTLNALTDDDIISVSSYQTHDTGTHVYYFAADLQDAQGRGAAVANFTPNPQSPLKPDHISTNAHLFAGASVGRLGDGDTTYIADEWVERLGRWYHDVPERIALVCHSSAAAYLVPGDVVLLTTARISPRWAGEDETYSAHACLVTAVATRWPAQGGSAPTTAVTLASLPAEYDAPV